MSNLEKAKTIIKENWQNADCGIFDCRNWTGDTVEMLYEDDELRIDICRYHSYFEVFGLSTDEFEELEKYYHELRGW